MFIAVYSGTHVVGGSNIGRKFLGESGCYIPSSFVGYVSASSGTHMYLYPMHGCILYYHWVITLVVKMSMRISLRRVVRGCCW